MLNAQSVENVRKSLTIGSSKELMTTFDNQIELSLNGNVSSYSQSQAEAILRDFFKNNSVSSFNYIHHGNSNNGQLKYSIGNLKTSTDSYRVLIRFKEVNNKEVVYNMKFTKE